MAIKKMMLLALSVGALVAFAVPAVAQAAELKENGVKLGLHSLVTATSTNLETTTAGGALFCAKTTIHGEITNAGGPGKEVRITPSSTTVESCEITGVGPVAVTNPSVGVIGFAGGTGSAASATFIADIPQECHFAGAVGFTYVNGSSTFSVPGSVLAGTGSGCPPEGTIAGSFSLETSNGTPVTVSG